MLVRGDKVSWTFFLSFLFLSHILRVRIKNKAVEHSTITALMANGITDGYVEVLNTESFAADTVCYHLC